MGRRRQYCRQSCRQRAYEQRASLNRFGAGAVSDDAGPSLYASHDGGNRWASTGCWWPGDHWNGWFQNLSFCPGDDGYLYCVSTGFQRDKGLMLSRVPTDRITDPRDVGSMTAHGNLALAHATMVSANEQRIANLIAYAVMLRTTGNTPDALAKLRVLESRIDAALGTAAPVEEPAHA